MSHIIISRMTRNIALTQATKVLIDTALESIQIHAFNADENGISVLTAQIDNITLQYLYQSTKLYTKCNFSVTIFIPKYKTLH